MHLKKIIISGFKSFADRVTVNFDKSHITGIVGPNGSGKSNIIDAVRWLMGEQNAKMLRGEKATDIIFAGSERRKPLGTAEVTLVFDNSDGSSFCPPEYRHEPEISLTRRLYIDGQREYAINKKTCRLKDIISFFASTGLGGRSYSMIQQGQVDRILQAKPEQIREIIEEASGTLIFKKRRNEAFNKLENTRLNLSRLDDIISELVRQKENLEAQVEAAKKFKEVSEELTEHETKLYTHNYHDYKDELLGLHEKLEKEMLAEAEASRLILEFEEEYESFRSELDESDPEVQALTERITVVREKIARSETSLLNAEKLLSGADERLVQLNNDIAEEDEHLKALESQAEKKLNSLSEGETKKTQIEELLETFEMQLSESDEQAQVFTNKIEECEDEIKNLDRMMEANVLRQEACQRDYAKAEREKVSHKERVSLLQSEVGQASILVDSAKVKVSGQKKGLDTELSEKHRLEGAIAQRLEDINGLKEERDQLKESYLSCKAKAESIESLMASAGNLRETIEALKESEVDQDLLGLGVLTDHLRFNENIEEMPVKCRQAFEAWAERLVVENIDALNELVRACKDVEIPSFSATVLERLSPIDQVALDKWCETYDAESLREYLSCDDERASQLLKRLYVLPMLNIERQAVAELPKGVLVFTAHGVILNQDADYRISGRTSRGALSYKSELEKLEQQRKSSEAKLAETQGKIDRQEAAQLVDREAIKKINEKLHEQNQAVLEVMAELNSCQQSFEHKQNLLEDAQGQFKLLEEASEKYGAQLQELKDSHGSLAQEKDQVSGELDETREESEHIMEQRAEISRQLDTQRVELIKASSDLQALKDSYNQVKEQLDILQAKMKRRYEQKSTMLADIEKAKSERGQLEKDIEHFVLEREKLEEDLASKREENAEILEKIRVIENKIKEGRSTLNGYQKTISQLQVTVEKVKSNYEATIEQAKERLNLNLEFHPFERDHDFNRTSTTTKVAKLKSKIDAMGPINMMAIKEFEELSQREEFIQAQREEVISSVELLEMAIEEIESNSREKFMATYEVLNKEFAELFPILFPRGDAQIELSDHENPLEGGVEIMVRLPGKKQQNMRLFSGGEKALTAIALIFALLKSKPTPFCFLDEVDAPLDETNVGRYNRVLEALSDRFQFIVITHNRRTMEVLDTLYGVTMQEPGVSKVVGVDMTKDLPSHLKKAFKETKRVEGATAQQ